MNFQEWSRHILDIEGLGNWTIEPGEAYCWLTRKVITFDTQDYALFLHEVAHALHPEPEGPLKNHYHGGTWAMKFGELVNKHMAPTLTLSGER